MDRKRARCVSVKPFTIMLLDRLAEDCAPDPLTLKIDRGIGTSGISLVRESTACGVLVLTVLCMFELSRRGFLVHGDMVQRAGHRSRRRSRLWYRSGRFDNRARPEGWLAPSVRHVVDSIFSFSEKLCRLAPVHHVIVDDAKFDTQKMQDPEISGAQFQRGTLFGYEIMECLLLKYSHRRVCCGAGKVPLQKDHVVP
jgi:hypothetical protein